MTLCLSGYLLTSASALVWGGAQLVVHAVACRGGDRWDSLSRGPGPEFNGPGGPGPQKKPNMPGPRRGQTVLLA